MIDSTNPSEEGNLIYQKIQQAKATGIAFRWTPPIFKPAADDRSITDHFLNLNEVSFIEYDPLIAADPLGKAILLTIPLKNGQFELELSHVPASFYDYTVTTGDGLRVPANKEIRHYRGIIKDDPNSLAAISLWKNEVTGLIANKDGNFNLCFDKQLGVHLLFNDQNLKNKSDFRCGTPSDDLTHYDPNVLLQSSRSSPNIIGGCIRIYLETTYDIYQTRGSLASVESFVTGLFNQVANVFENENIGVLLSDIYVWNMPDPYTASDSYNLLEEFKDERTSFDGDLGQLLTFRGLSDAGGRAAITGGLCNAQVKNRLSVARILNVYSLFPSPSWSVFIVSHEFGHLLGSEHTHDCVWNGNNTAIDGCKIPAGCSNPGLPPPNGGTIMSYCIEVTGIGIYLGFGPQPGNVIRNFVENAHCIIRPTISGDKLFCTSESYTIINLPIGATINDWNVSPALGASLSFSGNNCTVTRIGNFNDEIILTASITTPCGDMVLTRKLWIGIPRIEFVTIKNSVNDDPYFCTSHYDNEFKFNTRGYADTFDMFEVQLLSYPSMTLLHAQNYYGGEGVWDYLPAPGWYIFRARIVDHACGTPSAWGEYEVEFVNCS